MNESKQLIQFHYLIDSFTFTRRNALKAFLMERLNAEGKEIAAINYIFCDDAYLHQLNKTHLKHNTLTDIITFELSRMGEPLVADIYISIERVRENARLFNETFSRELVRVICHGTLHLAGYKDKTKDEAEMMRRKEDEYINGFNVSRNTVSSRNARVVSK